MILIGAFAAEPITASAEEETPLVCGDYEYDILDDGTVEVLSYLGSATSVTIPSQINGRAVTLIGPYSFRDNSVLKSVTIPDGITTIGYGAFYNCNKLAVVNIPNSVTSIEFEAFYGCISYKNIKIPDTVTNIENSAFYNTGLYFNDDKWDDGVLYIGNHLIKADCIDGDYEIREGTLTIADNAFEDCEDLESVTFPDSVRNVCAAFTNCTGIESMELGKGVETVAAYAFDGCSNLKSITFPASVKEIGENAFVGCAALTSLEVNSKNTAYCSIDGNLYSKDKTTLVQYAVGKTATVSGIQAKTYTDKALTQNISVKLSSKALVKSTDYTVAYKNNTNAGTATITITGKGKYTGTITKTFVINKAANPLSAKGSDKTVSYSTVKSKNVSVSAVTVSGAQGAVTYTKSSGNAKITVDSKTGKLTVKKGIKKSTYTVNVKVTAKGSTNYKSGTKTVAFKIKVK